MPKIDLSDLGPNDNNKKSIDLSDLGPKQDAPTPPPTAMAQAFQKVGLTPEVLSAAKQASLETLSEDLPGGIGKTVGQMRDLPMSRLGAPLKIAGMLLPKTGEDLGLLAIAGPLGEAAGIIGKPVVGGIAKSMPSVVSKLSRIELPFAQRAFERGVQVAGKIGVDAQPMIESFVSTIKETMKEARELAGKRMGAIEDKVVERMPYRNIPTADIGSRLENGLSRAGFNVPGMEADVKIPVSRETRSILNDFKNIQPGTPDQVIPGKVERKMASHGLGFEDVKSPDVTIPGKPAMPVQMNFKSALNLRRKMDRTLEFIEKGSLKVGRVEEVFLKQARRELNDRLLSADPLFRKANDAFARVAQAYRALAKDMMSGTEETISRRISRVFQKGTLERRMVANLDKVAQVAGATLDEVLDTLTASKFTPKINPSLEKAFYNTGGGPIGRIGQLLGGEAGAMYMGHPGAGPLAASAVLAGSSPRLSFEAMQLAKKIAEGISPETGKIAMQAAVRIPESLRRLMRKRVKEIKGSMDDTANP